MKWIAIIAALALAGCASTAAQDSEGVKVMILTPAIEPEVPESNSDEAVAAYITELVTALRSANWRICQAAGGEQVEGCEE